MAKGIVFFSKLSSLVANATFFIKNADFDEIISRVVLKNTAEPISGAQINNLQRYVNEVGDTTGYFEGDPDRKVYATNNLVTDGDNRKECIEVFDVAIQANIDQIADHEIRIQENSRIVNAPQVVADGGQLTLNTVSMNQVFRVSGDGAPFSFNLLMFTNQPKDGTIITLVGQDDINSIKTKFNDVQYGLKTPDDAELKKGYIQTLIYDAVLERYFEIGRNF